jgi:hypothetical protein
LIATARPISLAFGAALSALAVQSGCATGGDFPGTGSATPDVPSPADDGGCPDDYCVQQPGIILGEGDAGGVFISHSPLQPSFGATTVATRPPPAISGGTLLVMHDGGRAVAADPDRDAVYVVDLATDTVTHTIALRTGDEPGRLVEDGAGHVHVALREGGALVTIDPAAGTILSRRDACPAPRGVAYDASGDQVWVACATGELVALPAGGGAATRTLVVERDLRDVVVTSGGVAVSQFRSAQLLSLDATGNVSRRDQLPSPVAGFMPHVAWRTVAGPSGTFVSVHQAETTASLQTHVTGGYGGSCGMAGFGGFVGFDAGASTGGVPSTGGSTIDSCSLALDAGIDSPGGSALTSDTGDGAAATDDAAGQMPTDAAVVNVGPLPPPAPPFGVCTGPERGAVLSALTVVGADGTLLVSQSFPGVLPVDVAVSGDGTTIAAVAPGNAFMTTGALSTVFVFTSCATNVHSYNLSLSFPSLQPVAVAFGAKGTLLVQTREPAGLAFLDASGTLTKMLHMSTATRDDTGHDVFHTQAGGLIACASCHPEGRDDGHVWLLDGARRRTPSLRGTIAGTAPYHWPGDESTLDVLVQDVYTVRMSGQNLTTPVMGALQGWVTAVPQLRAPSWVDPAAASRGETLFNDATVGCSGCHAGEKFTNNTTVDVGTGGSFQVPPLVGVGWRTPLFHDGCATTIADRFGKCATSQHGNIAGLTDGDVSDLIAYLETL